MKKRVEVDIYLTPEELAKEIWDLTEEEQAIFLNELSQTCENYFSTFVYGLQYLADVIAADSTYNKQRVIKMLDKIIEYLKEDQ